MKDERRWVRILNRFSLATAAVSLVLALIIAFTGRGTAGSDYGPAAYYYTDIPEWREVFPEPSAEGLGNPVILLSFILMLLIGAVLFYRMTRPD